jgi:hypothetical protein
LEAQAKKMFAGIVGFVLLLAAGGIAAFHGGLIPLDSDSAAKARTHRILACESAVRDAAAAGGIAAIDDCADDARGRDGRQDDHSGSAMHSITVKFDYDFTKNPVCAQNQAKDKSKAKGKDKETCVTTFLVYDISTPTPYKLFSIPAPADGKGLTKGITATSPRMLFAVGRHRIGVAAVAGNGKESPPVECNTIVVIAPEGSGNAAPSH